MNLIRFYITILIFSLTPITSIFAAQVFQDPVNNHTILLLNQDEVAIFGYGSLMLKEELDRQIDTTYSGPFLEAYLSGFKRTWSANYPNFNDDYFFDENEDDYFIPHGFTYLNIEPSPNATVNGMIFVCSKSDLKSYDKREANYNRINVTDKFPNIRVLGGDAIAYTAKPSRFFPTENATKNETIIFQYYVDILEQALDHLGLKFEEDYYNSTQPLPTLLVFE